MIDNTAARGMHPLRPIWEPIWTTMTWPLVVVHQEQLGVATTDFVTTIRYPGFWMSTRVAIYPRSALSIFPFR